METTIVSQGSGREQDPSRLEHPLHRYLDPVRAVPHPVVQVLDEQGIPVGPAPPIAADDLLQLYRWMVRVRVFDTRMVNLQRQGRVAFFVPSWGEEAVQIGTAHALEPHDWIFSAYREQGTAMMRGYPPWKLICQILGNGEDLLKGRQMPDHFGAAEYRFTVASSPVGTQIPQAVGGALALRLRGEPSVAVTYFGDGASSTGDFHAGLTFAAVQQAPVVFFCKNNGWAISLPTARQCRAERLADKAIGYGLPGITVDGNDILAVCTVARDAVDWARSGRGPVLLEFLTQRMGPHSTADDVTRYRPNELLEPWKKRDPIHRFRLYLEGRGLWSVAAEQEFRAEVDEWFNEAIRRAEHQPPPAPETMFDDVYAVTPWHLHEQQDEVLQCRK